MALNLVPMTRPSVDIRHEESETTAFVGENDFGSGTLYITASSVNWISSEGRGFSLPYPSISMHAISRNPQSFPRPCIYMAVDLPKEKISRETNVNQRCFADKMAACNLKADSAGGQSDVGASGDNGEHNGSTHEESDEDDEESGAVEIRFAPANDESLDTMYHELCECQALHPDENESFSDEECEDGEIHQFGGASDEFQFDDHGQLVLSRMRGVRPDDDAAMEHEQESSHAHDDDEDMETEQFEDAQ